MGSLRKHLSAVSSWEETKKWTYRQIWEQNWARMILIEMGLNICHLVV